MVILAAGWQRLGAYLALTDYRSHVGRGVGCAVSLSPLLNSLAQFGYKSLNGDIFDNVFFNQIQQPGHCREVLTRSVSWCFLASPILGQRLAEIVIYPNHVVRVVGQSMVGMTYRLPAFIP